MTTRFAKKLSNGKWQEITQEHVMKVLEKAVAYQTVTLAARFPGRQPDFVNVEEALDALVEKGTVKWDDEWYATLAAKQDESQKVESKGYQKTLDCGCVVYSPSHIMQTSYSGTACPSCYDMIESQGYGYKRRK